MSWLWLAFGTLVEIKLSWSCLRCRARSGFLNTTAWSTGEKMACGSDGTRPLGNKKLNK